MQLAGRARQQGLRPLPAAPAAGEAREPAADEVGGEVLGGDAGRPGLPALAEVGEVGQDNIAQDGRQGQPGDEPVQDGLRGRLVEGVQSPAEPGERLAACEPGGLAGEPADSGTRAASERGAPPRPRSPRLDR